MQQLDNFLDINRTRMIKSWIFDKKHLHSYTIFSKCLNFMLKTLHNAMLLEDAASMLKTFCTLQV